MSLYTFNGIKYYNPCGCERPPVSVVAKNFDTNGCVYRESSCNKCGAKLKTTEVNTEYLKALKLMIKTYREQLAAGDLQISRSKKAIKDAEALAEEAGKSQALEALAAKAMKKAMKEAVTDQ